MLWMYKLYAGNTTGNWTIRQAYILKNFLKRSESGAFFQSSCKIITDKQMLSNKSFSHRFYPGNTEAK